MKAENTVIKRKVYHPSIQLLLEEQAEISFKAGTKEVMGWIEGNRINGEFKLDNKWQFRSQFFIDEYRAKLKEWGFK